MSIFPRKLTRGENCIIHLKFENTGKKPKKILYNLTILDPNGDKVTDISDKFLLNCDSNSIFKKELYYSFNTSQNTALGKYRVIPTFYYDGMKYRSRTSNFDYFLVEEINVESIGNNEFLLKNESPYRANILLKENKHNNCFINNIVLEGYEKRKIKTDAEQKFIMYGNNYLKELFDIEDIVYMRNSKMFWKKNKEKIIVYTKEDKVKILDDKYLNIWILLDGIRTNKEICNLLQLELDELLKIESELLKLDYIVKIN